MKLTTRFGMVLVAIFASVALVACGGGGGGGGGGGSNAITVQTDGENLAFRPTELTAPANTQFTVTFNNTSAAQLHNFVLVKDDTVAQRIATEGAAAGQGANYLPSDLTDVFGHTKILQPGTSETVTFAPLPAGTYEFICTVPGHYPLMKGTFTVR